MNKPKNVRLSQGSAPKPLTQQEQIAAISRGFTQQFNSIAQGVLFNLVHGYASAGSVPKESIIVEQAISITEDFMEKVGPACDKAFDLIVVHKGIPEDERKEGE